MTCCVQGNISDKIRNTAGTGDLLIFPFLGLCLATLACTACKFLTKPSLLQRYRSGIVESTANGTVNCFCLVGVLIGISGSISTTVRQAILSSILKSLILEAGAADACEVDTGGQSQGGLAHLLLTCDACVHHTLLHLLHLECGVQVFSLAENSSDLFTFI